MINCSRVIEIKDINAFEEKHSLTLPDYFKDLYLVCNGGELKDERRIFCNDYYELDIDHFLPMVSDDIYNSYTIESLYKVLKDKHIIEPNYVPFAIDGGSFPFCINTIDNKLYYINIESNKILYLADNFEQFISQLHTEEDAYN